MSTLTCTIGGVSYSVKTQGYGSLDVYDALEVRGSLIITIEDYAGTASFVYGQPVVLSDSVLGTLFQGFVGTDKPTKPGPASTTVEHYLTIFDKQYLVDKRTNYSNYLGWYAGDIVVDFVQGTLAAEGVTVAAAMRRDSTTAQFNQGTLSGVVGATGATGDGDLDLAPAGSDVSFSESTTADFSTGTLTNCTAANNTLTPNTQNALKFSAFLPISTDTSGLVSKIYVKFWTGSMTVGVSDTLNFDVWIAGSSPEKVGGIVPLFSDLTVPGGIYDQNGLLNDGDTDLTSYAVNQWYTRNESLAAYNGKTIIAMLAQVESHSVGTYTWYVKNAYLGSQTGNKFFSTTSTAPQLNPPTVYQYRKFITSTFTASVVSTFDPNNSYRISPSHSIDAVKLLKSSNILWGASDSVRLYASYNGGSSWIPCTNGAVLPGLPIGSNVSGLSMQLKEVFAAGNAPDALSVLDSVSVSLLSAPNATKSDIVTSFLTQSNWNTGTHSATQADVSGNLELAPYTRDWNDTLTTGQTNFFPSGTSATASSGAYVMTCGANSGVGTNGFGTSRLDFLGTALDFTLECDVKASNANTEASITYRQIYWNSSTNNTFGYLVGVYPGSPGIVEIGYGSNSNSSAFTQLAQITPNLSTGTTYHVKLVVNGNRHQFYFNNSATPTFDIIDNTYTQAGGIGLRGYNADGGASHTATWDNLVLAQQPSGTWTSPSTSVSSLTTCGGSVITWTEQNTSNPAQAYAFVQSSIDGGSTYQQCTSGSAIPGLTNGVSLASKSVLIQCLLGTQTNTVPMISGLVWRVLGVYPGSSGTRSTAPLGNDTVISRPDQSGWGTAFDSQTWAKTGTATDAVSSNQLLLTNTTGDVHERLGSRTDDDEEITVEFQLTASTITGGAELRYVDANNLYRLAVSTIAISIVKIASGGTTTLATVSASLSTSVWYWLRFRVVGSTTVSLYGRVWASGTLEDQTTWTITASD